MNTTDRNGGYWKNKFEIGPTTTTTTTSFICMTKTKYYSIAKAT